MKNTEGFSGEKKKGWDNGPFTEKRQDRKSNGNRKKNKGDDSVVESNDS